MSRFLSKSVSCPKCSYGDCMRIPRTILDKILRSGKKYRCNHCRYKFFVKEKKEGNKNG